MDLQVRHTRLVDGEFYYRNSKEILKSERRTCVPSAMLDEVLKWFHKLKGDMQVNRTQVAFRKEFQTAQDKETLKKRITAIVGKCKCQVTKSTGPVDAGLVGALPLPTFVNTIRYVDSTALPKYKGFNDLFVVVDALSRYVQC